LWRKSVSALARKSNRVVSIDAKEQTNKADDIYNSSIKSCNEIGTQ
jgi:hypothetical protein